jgi:surfactin synthase thioesterase subunit
MGEPFTEDFATLVAQLCAEHAESLSGRYALFGHSMGALLAWGIAQRQCALARPLPWSLIVSASSAPSQRDPERFAGMNNDAALIADLRKQGGTPDEVFDNVELLRIALDSLAADYRVCGSFSYAAPKPLSIPVHVLAGREDDISAASIEAWRQEAAGAFSLDWFDGGHFFIRQREQEVLTVIVRELVHHFSGVGHAADRAA